VHKVRPKEDHIIPGGDAMLVLIEMMITETRQRHRRYSGDGMWGGGVAKMMKVIIMVSIIMINPSPSGLCLVRTVVLPTCHHPKSPAKVENMLHGLSDALTRYISVTIGRRATADTKK
jgi:hypothetical protein